MLIVVFPIFLIYSLMVSSLDLTGPNCGKCLDGMNRRLQWHFGRDPERIFITVRQTWTNESSHTLQVAQIKVIITDDFAFT